MIKDKNKPSVIEGSFAFELFDTYGFPKDLTCLMARELGIDVDLDGFEVCMQEQQKRSRQAAEVDHEDWVEVHPGQESVFVGYDQTECKVHILRYRKVTGKNKTHFQLVLDTTPFYAESGGQCGDTGKLTAGSQEVVIEDTKKENNLWIHLCSQLPADPSQEFIASVDTEARSSTAANHSATHLMHAALKAVLGSHVEQKGSLVNPERLRFDFAHFSKMSPEEILATEKLVNAKIRANIPLNEFRDYPIEKAREMGAVALFGEKYGDHVRVIAFDPGFSIELCGGTHVQATGHLGYFKIVSESAIAAGIRRIEAVTGKAAEALIEEQFSTLASLREVLKGSKDVVKNAETLVKDNAALQKQIQEFQVEMAKLKCVSIAEEAVAVKDIRLVVKRMDLDSQTLKNIATELRSQYPHMITVLGSIHEAKPGLLVSIPEELVQSKNLDAGAVVRELAKDIQGGGGGQKVFATAGGKEVSGLEKALEKAPGLIASLV